MKTYQKIGLIVAGVGLGIATIIGGIRSCDTYQINAPNFTANSRATGYFYNTKIEYAKLKDGSEEVLIREPWRTLRYQNLDGDNTVDRIRVDKFKSRDLFCLENILIRSSDFLNN